MRFAIDKPRFGVEEVSNSAGQAALLVAEELSSAPGHLLQWVLWREAVLELLCPPIRAVPETADLGLYAGLKYGITDRQERERLQRVWESTSPPQYHQFYSYFPTAGFAAFDKVVDGDFLPKVVRWLNSTFGNVPISLTSSTLTSALERWMLDFHRPLSQRELRVLVALCEQPNISQNQLAERVELSQASVSRILRQLADSHLLRSHSEVNLPLIGLTRVAATLYIPSLRTLQALRRFLQGIRYALLFSDFDGALHCVFSIPSRRIGRFRRWITELTAAWDLPPPAIRTARELTYHRDFTLYNPEHGGWPLDYEPILENVSRLIREDWAHMLPNLQSFHYAEPRTLSAIRLRCEDFVYIQRSVGEFLLTNRVTSTRASETRVAGYRETEHMSYRRRVHYLDRIGLVSPPLGITLFHIGLDGVINLLLEGSYDKSITIIRALQLLPHTHAVVYDDGSATLELLVPKVAAVDLKTSLQSLLTDSGVEVLAIVKPAWEAHTWSQGLILDSRNYDFDRGDWLWTKDTLPEIQPPTS